MRKLFEMSVDSCGNPMLVWRHHNVILSLKCWCQHFKKLNISYSLPSFPITHCVCVLYKCACKNENHNFLFSNLIGYDQHTLVDSERWKITTSEHSDEKFGLRCVRVCVCKWIGSLADFDWCLSNSSVLCAQCTFPTQREGIYEHCSLSSRGQQYQVYRITIFSIILNAIITRFQWSVCLIYKQVQQFCYYLMFEIPIICVFTYQTKDNIF